MGKTAVITGASGGIGQALTESFRQAGYRVFCGCNSHPERLPEGVWGMAADLTDPQQAKAFADAVLQLLQQKELRKKLGQQALEDSKQFSAESMAEAYCNIYLH